MGAQRLKFALLIGAAAAAITLFGAAAQAQENPAPAAAAGEAATPAPPPDDAAGSFLMRCSGCHTIGGGPMKGPDLAGATQWTADQLTPAVKRMDKYAGAISDADAAMLVDLLRDPKVRERLQAEQQKAAAKMAASLDPPNVAIGDDLYWGRAALANGGLSCASCHTVNRFGGTMGPDLTQVAQKLNGIALVSAIEKSNFLVMQAAYRDHPITKQEAVHLAAFFERIADEPGAASASAQAASGSDELPGVLLAGLALAAVVLAGVAIATRKQVGGTRVKLIQLAHRK